MEQQNLIGIWKTDPNDELTQKTYGNVVMEFKSNGVLIYEILEGGKEEKIIMKYEVNGNVLTTDQPSSPQKVDTNFVISGKRLELYFEGIKSVYFKLS